MYIKLSERRGDGWCLDELVTFPPCNKRSSNDLHFDQDFAFPGLSLLHFLVVFYKDPSPSSSPNPPPSRPPSLSRMLRLHLLLHQLKVSVNE